MPRVCAICGKKTTFGRSIARRGRAKYLGGVGVKTTGISKRTFKPNIQKVRTVTGNGTVKRQLICTQCIRNGKVTKPMRRPKAGEAARG
jgi:large subunit ribosomal protein L28